MPEILTADWEAYELLDSGNRQKLERFGEVTVVRSEPKAWWRPDHEPELWNRADATFTDEGNWQFHRKIKRVWNMPLHGLNLQARLTDMSKHVGVFPEQEPHWRWMRNQLSQHPAKEPHVLNLFGYTGVASLVASQAGAHVTHVDASKPAISWARDNQARCGLQERPIRWILEDAGKYVAREIRRQSYYDGILLDPPSFGRGPKGEVWKVEEQIADFLAQCRQLLNREHSFLILTLYNIEASPLMIENLMRDTFEGGTVTVGELALPHARSSKRLPLSLFGRWEA